MDNKQNSLNTDVFSTFHQLAKAHPQLEDAQMLVGASDAKASLKKEVIRRSVDADWINVIENALPYLDLVIRNPSRAIEDVEEVVPVELSRRISEKSIRHLAQHTNLIQKIEGDEITPSKILNVFREEALVTYENKFINTLINRLFGFVDRRYQALKKGSGAEQKYQLEYTTRFNHDEPGSGQTDVEVGLNIALTTPMADGMNQQEKENSENYRKQFRRVEKIYNTVLAYMGSGFVKALGKNFIRPPVIRTNAILKNKNMRVCLDLWEYIEGCDKAGYTVAEDAYSEMPSDEYIRDLYNSIALQYVQFYNGVTQKEDNRLLSERHLEQVAPDFETRSYLEEDEDYNVYDTQYHKMVPVSRLMSSRKRLSEQENKIKQAIDIALKADKAAEQKRLAEEAERRRLAEEAERRRLAEEAERKRLAEEAEQKRLAEEAERRRLAEEAEKKRLAEEAKRKRLEEEAERRRIAEEAERRRLEAEAEKKRLAEEAERKRREAEAEATRLAEAARAETERLAREQAAIQQAIAAEAQRTAQQLQAKQQEEEAQRQQIAEEVQAIFREHAEENRRMARQKQEHIAAADAEQERLEQQAEARRQAEEKALELAEQAEAARIARQKQAAAEAKQQREAAAAEDNYYYSRDAYVSLPRKKKKKILTDLRRLQDYEAKANPNRSSDGPFTGPYWEEIRRWERSVTQSKK